MSRPTDSSVAGPGRSNGLVAAGFEPVRERFDSYLADDADFSAQLVVSVEDRVVLDLWGGPHLSRDSVTGVYSASKGISAITIATLVDGGSLDLDERVAAYWPEFAAFDKGRISVRQLLSHQAGLVNTRTGLTVEEFYNSAHAAELLAMSPPAWQPGAAFGYHALTIGPLIEELVRRVARTTLQRCFEERVRAPRDIDFHLGLPTEQDGRYVPLRPSAEHKDASAVLDSPDGFPELALGLTDDPDAFSTNSPRARAFGSGSIGGVGSARGLAAAYAAMISHDSPLVGPETMEAMSRLQVDGTDLVLDGPMRFGVLFMKPRPTSSWGSYRAFGHDGAAGALAFADPTYHVAFGYIPLPAPHRGGADARAVELSRLVRECVRRRALPGDPMRPRSLAAPGSTL